MGTDAAASDREAVAVVIPARDEQETVGFVVRDARTALGLSAAIYVVADGCVDDTARVARAAGAVVLTTSAMSRGLGSAYRLGVERAIADGAKVVASLDGDRQYRASDLPPMVAEVARGADLVVGDRFARGRPSHVSRTRHAANLCASRTFLLGIDRVKLDVQSGIRVVSAETVARIALTESFTYTQEQIVKALVVDLRVVSVPVEFHPRVHGASRLTRCWPRFALKATFAALRARRWATASRESVLDHSDTR